MRTAGSLFHSIIRLASEGMQRHDTSLLLYYEIGLRKPNRVEACLTVITIISYAARHAMTQRVSDN